MFSPMTMDNESKDELLNKTVNKWVIDEIKILIYKAKRKKRGILASRMWRR